MSLGAILPIGFAMGFVLTNSCAMASLPCSSNLPFLGDLVLDPDSNKCDYRENARLCNTQTPQDVPYRALELFDCINKTDGLYSSGFCDSYFYSCTNGTKDAQLCPFQQFFDEATGRCDHKENVPECQPENLKPRPRAQPIMVQQQPPMLVNSNPYGQQLMPETQAPPMVAPPRPIPELPTQPIEQQQVGNKPVNQQSGGQQSGNQQIVQQPIMVNSAPSNKVNGF